jgi:hypothetical protein
MESRIMAHWAEISEDNTVMRVLVGDNNDPNGDEGYQWLLDNLGGTWLKTSYNAIGGKRRNPETNEIIDEPGFRKNFAGIGFKYNSELDAFVPPQPFDSWLINEETGLWEAPIPMPQDGNIYLWNESTLSWERGISKPWY